jgi:hypothetical protein
MIGYLLAGLILGIFLGIIGIAVLCTWAINQVEEYEDREE